MTAPMWRGRLMVVSAPSGAGKSTLCRLLLKRHKNVVLSVSATTRQPRPQEKDGRDYFFVSEAAFQALRKRGELLEWAEVHGHHYGTPKHFLEKQVKAGKHVLLEIDVQGALQVKKRHPDAILIFITTPDFHDLERRLRHRSSETETELRRRLANARQELRYLKRYDYHVVNDRIPLALRRLEAILAAESLRIQK